MFNWDPPPGSGPEAIVDNYNITITPAPVSHSSYNVVTAPPWNVTLNYNVIYTATVTASNCAGDSDIMILSAIEYSECLVSNYFNYIPLLIQLFVEFSPIRHSCIFKL